MGKIKLKVPKIPRQSRSRQMVEDIVTAAIRVLDKTPGGQFTTILVAREAGVSVGSLYQYFPDKGSILFEIQMREWSENAAGLSLILKEVGPRPIDLINRLVSVFFESEWKERRLRRSLKEAMSIYKKHDAFQRAEAKALSEFSDYLMLSFSLSKRKSDSLSEFFLSTMTALAENASDRILKRKDFNAWKLQATDMILRHLEMRVTTPSRR